MGRERNVRGAAARARLRASTTSLGSRPRWRHAWPMRTWRANSLRTQEQLVTGNLLPAMGGLRYNGSTTSRARRPGAVGPVRRLLGGTTSPANFVTSG